MRFGVCAPISEAARLYKIGFDYVEVSAASLAAMTEEEFAAFCAENRAAPIHAEAANCLFPGEIRLTGDAVDTDAVQSYIDRVMARLGDAGIGIAVFGSGGSRRVPEGFSETRALEQLRDTARRLGEAAAVHGVTVVLEPLRRAETNILNTQPESLAFVQSVGHPHCKLLCDYYHLVVEGGTPEMVAACGDALRHVHIANPDGRVAMKPDDKADYKAFFDALRRAGYDARVSFEGSASDYEAELPAALEVLRNA